MPYTFALNSMEAYVKSVTYFACCSILIYLSLSESYTLYPSSKL